MTIRWLIISALAPLCLVTACRRSVPREVADTVEKQKPNAIALAEQAAAQCAALKQRGPFAPSPVDAPPPPPSPAVGSPLASEPHVVDVLVSCSWPDPRGGGAWGGTSFPKLKGPPGPPLRNVAMPENLAMENCSKDAHHCEQVRVPSWYHPSESSADIRVLRPTPDGGEIEVVVAISP